MFDCLSTQIESLLNFWSAVLPYTDALISHVLFNTSVTRLYTGRIASSNTAVGPMVKSTKLGLSKVINKQIDKTKLLELTMKRYVNNFELIIDNLYDDNGKLELPRYLQS